ncbi:GIY-YIG nuclease family protein [Intestinibacter bartlettii]|uniref:GIY-YIG nuclease family protein n=1 Tax=Intestinibacter bartlettii TaxID=261299 RepID=UPI003995A8DB
MKNEFYLKSFTSKWIKYSDYEFRKDEKGNTYITPAENSDYTIYDPFEKSRDILFDLIDLGDAILKNDDKTEIYDKLILFAKNYGLLGLVSSSIYNRDIVGEQNVLFTQNNIVSKSLELDGNLMNSEEYIKIFTPFATEDDLYTREFDGHLTVIKAEDSPKFYGKKPLILDIVFSKFYCERIEWIMEYAKNISENLNQAIVYQNENLTEPVEIMPDKFNPHKIGFTVAMFGKPQINWDFDSLQSTIDMIYAFALTEENRILNRCSYCHKPFFAKNTREKYCTPSCRNCANVIKSRNKKKALKNQDMVNTQKNDDIKTLNNQCEEKICLDDTKSDLIEKEIKNILEIIDKRIIENINIKTHKVGADDMKNEKRKQAIYEYKEKKTTGGVYKITNTESKKSLIKGEIDLASMQNRFNFSVKTNSCLNLKLRNDWNKYGANSFTFEILEEVEMKSEMDRRQFKKQLDELADKYSEKMNEDELY